MKNLIPLAFFLVLTLLFTISCDNAGPIDDPNGETVVAADEENGEDPGDTEVPLMINPNRGYYDVVVMDIDRWELCLNVERSRYHCISYTGHLWYQMGAYIFEGTLTAVYNHQLDQLAVTALDSGWDRGHIMYSLQFIEGTNDLYGSFVYFEFPRRTNGIDCWLVQGSIGPHTYGLAASSEPPAGPVAMEHPKKARYFAEME